MTQTKPLTVIGPHEYVQFIDDGDELIPAKIDTGADTSSVWASGVEEKNNTLQFCLFAPGSPYYTGQVITLSDGQFRPVHVVNSFGAREFRYVVKLKVRIKGRRVKASFSLADRSMKNFPILIGNRLLRGKFLVDASQEKIIPPNSNDQSYLEVTNNSD